MKSTEIRTKQRILIVDDSEMNRAILADMLGEGYEILEAENGLEAVAYLKKLTTNIDLLLLDIMMPLMDGFEVLAVMNKYHMISDIPVIMILQKALPLMWSVRMKWELQTISAAPLMRLWFKRGWKIRSCFMLNRSVWSTWWQTRFMRRKRITI